MEDIIQIEKQRPLSTTISSLIYHRWSPRSMTGESLTEEELRALFEAARLAPSCYNAQPWRFIYCRNTDPEWASFLSLLVEFNQEWAKNAAALLIIASRTTFEHNNKPSQTHSFDAGASWMSLALEASHRGLVAHGMQGFDYQKATELIQLPEEYAVEAMVAVGRRAPKEHLSPALQAKEFPSPRKPLQDIVFRGTFSSKS